MADTPRKRRWPWFLAITLALLAAAGLWVNHQLEPNRLARRVLEMVGPSQGLEISFRGTPSYGLWPEPRLVLPKVTARQPGADSPLLTAERAEISLPWDTVHGDGPMVITYIELDQPALDLAAFRDWRDSRPETNESTIPTLSRGVLVTGGSVQGEGWRVQDMDLALGPVAPGESASLEFSGGLASDSFQANATGTLDVAELSESTRFELFAEGEIEQDERVMAYSLQAPCRFHRHAPETTVNCGDVDFKGDSPLPSLRADMLSMTLDGPDGALLGIKGWMRDWPADWPVLPEPQTADVRPTRFDIHYQGAADFSDPVSVKVERGETRLDATLVIAEVQAWLANEDRTPLPPMLGRFTAPSLEIEGFTLENVQADIVEPAPASEE
ncbi:hypothetical protein [Arenimonas sp.]|uniref:hypothetical protein n=1 Tax=Arenimonas sp. TaxID=1872635 RepID=UPI0035AF3EF3